jgi:hypothetical protein
MDNKAASQTKARVIILAVFVLGLAAGALSTNLYQRLTNSGPARPDRPHGGKPTDYVLDKMNNRLNLSPDQQASIREILKGTFDQYDGIKKDIEPRMDVVRQQGRQRIRELLRPDQLPKYEEMVREHDAEREKMKNEGK